MSTFSTLLDIFTHEQRPLAASAFAAASSLGQPVSQHRGPPGVRFANAGLNLTRRGGHRSRSLIKFRTEPLGQILESWALQSGS